MRRGIPALEMELHLAPFPVKRMWFTKCLLVTSMEWALLLSAIKDGSYGLESVTRSSE